VDTLRLALHLLVADGLIGLFLADLLGPVTAVITGAGLLVSWWTAPRLVLRPSLGRAFLLVAWLAALIDTLWLAESTLDGLVRFLLFLVLYHLLTLSSVRETRRVAFLAFFMLVLAASSAFGVEFLFVLLAFVGLGTWVMLLQTQVAQAPDLDTGGLIPVAVAASVGVVVVTAVFFFVIPRVGLAALPFRLRTGPMITGFSDKVELGAYGEIETDSTVVMRVHMPEWTPQPDRIPALRWRGVVLDHFDGRVWRAREPRRVPLERPAGDFLLGLPRGTGRLLVQDIYLEPLGTAVLFGAPRVLTLRLRAGDSLSVDDMGSISAPAARSRLRYTVVSEVERMPPVRPGPRRAPPPLDAEQAARFLQLPPLPARVAELAQRVSAGSRDPYEAALRVSEHLAREYRYTLVLERRTTLDPVDEFLFVRRSGNCEYFAAALAVMLRSLGIPARVVNGFQRGEWNPYGHYFMVRLQDAHSWVEAYVGGLGWVTLDPSPRSAGGSEDTWGAVTLYLDSLRMRWHRYVVNWTLRDQMQAAWTFRQYAGRPWLELDSADRTTRAAAAVAIAVLLGLLVLRTRRDARGAARAAAVPRFYTRALAALARRGLVPAPGETAREFADRVGAAAPACAPPLGTLTGAYEQARFGAAPPGAAAAAELDACLVALERAARR
jgi:transglutaminase-like putative cysteine protease